MLEFKTEDEYHDWCEGVLMDISSTYDKSAQGMEDTLELLDKLSADMQYIRENKVFKWLT